MITTLEEFANRRGFLRKTGILLTNAVLAGSVVQVARAKPPGKEEAKEGEKISPPEDLMREHGVLRRILLIYEDIQGHLNSGKAFPVETLSNAAEIIQKFVEQYHEKLEEDYLFPLFDKAKKLADLVDVLKEQHRAGRRLTEIIKKSAVAATLLEAPKRNELADRLHMFIRMYRPHAAREDTILFPASRTVVSEKEFYDLGEEFEDREERLFGEGGFEKIVIQVAELEKKLGIYELSQFTPPER
jgi:hemerythrin-like domain-containing protein